jgi:hypothetical protein
MESVEYFDRPLPESGTIHPGETEVWFKDFIHDVSPIQTTTNSSIEKFQQKIFQMEHFQE